MTFNPVAYKHDYYRAHKAELLAYNKRYYARPENIDYFKNYREGRREHNKHYAKHRRAMIKAGLWTFRDPKKSTKQKKPTHIEAIQTRWQAYFDRKKNK